MLVKFNEEEKKIIGKLVKAGNDLYCNGQGWHFNDICFASFKEFWTFCEFMELVEFSPEKTNA